ncbi:hypothetical protein [Rhodococcus qingshengii]|uniref:hypothetical protein n=1 Tax=Rhodococcus qingshengii TaxID=334542 RepID=UPI002AFDE3F5|nr:hypothetical protein [Rhodococcus qingshengii]MEA1798526.1 hypothetical protein [Rhodococcus qingshengii]
MTAPDPGLTDLVAAHRLKQSYWNWWGCTGCDWRTKGTYGSEPTIETATEHAKHVVEQHTNRRIAELEAMIARVKALVQDDSGEWLPYWRATTSEIRAALEGE